MPGWNFWLPVLAAFLVTWATGLTTAIAQAKSTQSKVGYYGRVLPILGGILAAIDRAKDLWPR